jgi:hypothetical protein
MENCYEIVRLYNPVYGKQAGRRAKVIKRGVTLEEAQEHCNRPDTHKYIQINGDRHVEWFDGWRAS